MIASCPQCESRYRVAPEKIGPGGARLRCTRCKTVFRVDPSPEGAGKVTSPGRVSGVQALVAEGDSETAQRIVEFLARWGIDGHAVHDGGEALLRIYRSRPPLAILGGNLPGVAAPVVAEIVRRSSELKPVRLIRVAPMDQRAGAPEFDADHTLEPAELPDGLGDLLEQLGLGKRPEAPAPRSIPKPAPEAAPAPPVAAAKRPPERRERSAQPEGELAAAERLTRIIVSDIILYDDAKFVRAAKEGNVVEAFQKELAEANALFDQRVPESIRSKRAFIEEELRARAEKRRQTL